MVTTGGVEGETKRKRKFVARTEGENQEERKEGEGGGERGDGERERDIPDVLSWSTYFVVDEASRFFVSTPLCFVISPNFLRPKIRKRHAVRHSPPAPFAVIYIRDPSKLWVSRDRYYFGDNDPLYTIFSLGKKGIRRIKSINIVRMSRSNDILHHVR